MQLSKLSLLAPLVLLTAAQVSAQDTERAKLTASDGTSSDRFGVSLTTAGDMVIVGAPYADLPGAPFAGAVYIFERSGVTWTQTAKLTAATPDANAQFGASVDFDGTTLFVGAPFQTVTGVDINGAPTSTDQGAVTVFEYSPPAWIELETLELSVPSGRFGRTLAVHGDRAAVAYQVFNLNSTNDFVRFYSLENGAWMSTGLAFLGFRLSVDLEIDEDVLVIGAPGLGEPDLARVYERSADSFSLLQDLTSPPQILNSFGSSVALDGDSFFLTGSGPPPQFDTVLLEYRRSGGGPFVQQAIPGVQVDSQFHELMGLSVSDNDLWLGFSEIDVPGAPAGGDVRRATQAGGVWTEDDRRVASDPVPTHALGRVVDSSGRFAAAATADGVDDAVYVFDVDSHQEFCFGDGSSPAGCGACPCGNDAPSGTIGGCLNSSQRSARLLALGRSSITSDSLQMELLGAQGNSFAILLSGDNALPQSGTCPVGSGIDVVGAPFDGLRCAGSQLVRHGIRSTDLQGDAASAANPGWGGDFLPASGLLSQLSSPSGATRHFQVIYRDLPTSGCGTGLNSTNAVSVQLRP